MKKSGRTTWISLRLTPEEKEQISAQAEKEGMSVGDYVRDRLNQPRVRSTKIEREKILQLVKIGNNLNQVARWANTYKGLATSVQVLAQLAAIERELRCL